MKTGDVMSMDEMINTDPLRGEIRYVVIDWRQLAAWLTESGPVHKVLLGNNAELFPYHTNGNSKVDRPQSVVSK